MRKTGSKTPPPPVRRAFADRLRAYRTVYCDSAKDFAQELGVEHGTYTRWERAETEPDYTTLTRICATLGITPNDLLLPKPKKNRTSQLREKLRVA